MAKILKVVIIHIDYSTIELKTTVGVGNSTYTKKPTLIITIAKTAIAKA